MEFGNKLACIDLVCLVVVMAKWANGKKMYKKKKEIKMKTKKEKLSFKKLTIANLDNMGMRMIYGGKPGTGTLCTEICIPSENPTDGQHVTNDYTCL
jgi:hypothetical protein